MTSKRRWVIGGAAAVLTMAVAAGAVRLQDKLFRNTGVTAMATVRTAENNSLGAAQGAKSAPTAEDEAPGLRFRLSEGKPLLGDAAKAVPLANTTPLSDADADRILDRLKAVGAKPEDVQGFALREGSLPPPRAGQTVATTFPPPRRPMVRHRSWKPDHSRSAVSNPKGMWLSRTAFRSPFRNR